MPAAVAAVITWWGSVGLTIAGATISVGALIQSAVLVAGLVEANRAKQAARGAYNASLRDRTVTLRSPEAPRRTVYGAARVGGVLVYGCNSGAKREYLHLVLALADHKLTSIDDVWLADKSIGTLDGSGYVQSGSVAFRGDVRPDQETFVVPGSPYQHTLPYSANAIQSVVMDLDRDQYEAVPYTSSGSVLTFTAAEVGKTVRCTYTRNFGEARLQIVQFLGDPAADTALETASAGQWTSAHTGSGIARIRATFKPDPETFPQGLQNLSAIVHGKKLYDPRTSTYAWSENPALQVLDYLMADHGFRATLSEIDLPSFIAAANICDEDVPVTSTGDTQARYAGGGIISEDADRFENLKGLLSSMVGECVQVAGVWFVRAGAFYSSSITLTDSDFAGGTVQITANTPRRSLFNGVKGRFIDPDALWTYTDFPPYTSSTYQTEDGGEQILADIDLPFIQDATRAQRVAKLVLFKARQSMVVQAEFKLKALAITPLTTIRVKNTEFGWDTIDGGLGKLFVVKERTFNPDRMTVTLTMQEEAAEVYDWDYSEAITPDPSPNTTLRDPRDIDPLAGFGWTSDATTFQELTDGTVVPFVLVEWDAVTDSLVTDGGNIRVIWKRANEENYQSILLPGSATSYQIDGIGPGEILNIGGCAINGAQVSSSYVFDSHAVSAALQTNSQSPAFGLGTNLLSNASLKSGVTGWASFMYSGYTGAISHILGANGAPRPFGAVLLSATGSIGASAAQAYPNDLRVPVSAGQRIEAQVKVENFRGNAGLWIGFYNSSDTFLGKTLVSGGVDSTTADSATFSQALADFKHLWGFVTAPAGAVSAQPIIESSRTSTSLPTDIYIGQPYIGVAHANQTLPSPWTDGPPRGALAMADLATTALISPSAATAVNQSQSSSTGTVTATALGDVFADLYSVTISNSDATSQVVVVNAAIECTASASTGVNTSAGIVILDSTEASSYAGIPANEAGSWMFAPASSSARGALQSERRFNLAAGASETYRIVMIAQVNCSAAWSRPKIKTEQIKR